MQSIASKGCSVRGIMSTFPKTTGSYYVPTNPLYLFVLLTTPISHDTSSLYYITHRIGDDDDSYKATTTTERIRRQRRQRNHLEDETNSGLTPTSLSVRSATTSKPCIAKTARESRNTGSKLMGQQDTRRQKRINDVNDYDVT